jgi:hypothetical protein
MDDDTPKKMMMGNRRIVGCRTKLKIDRKLRTDRDSNWMPSTCSESRGPRVQIRLEFALVGEMNDPMKISAFMLCLPYAITPTSNEPFGTVRHDKSSEPARSLNF